MTILVNPEDNSYITLVDLHNYDRSLSRVSHAAIAIYSGFRIHHSCNQCPPLYALDYLRFFPLHEIMLISTRVEADFPIVQLNDPINYSRK